MDWLAQPRCMLVTMDDGTLRLFGLDNAGSNTPFTGKPYSGTQLQGLQSYFCSSFSLWAAQASRTLGTFSPPSLPPSACLFIQKHILLLVILWTPLMLSYDLLCLVSLHSWIAHCKMNFVYHGFAFGIWTLNPEP
jgi:hypothetical protein